MKIFLRTAGIWAVTTALGCGDPAPVAERDVVADTTVGVDTVAADSDSGSADISAEDVGQDVAPDSFVLPNIDRWLLLTPDEGLGTIAVQPTVAWDDEGRLAVAWTGRVGEVSGIFGGLFAMAQAPVAVTGPAALTAIETGLRNVPSLCATADGAFVGAWSADLQNGRADNLAIYYRRFDGELKPLTSNEVTLATARPGNHWLASLACSAEGGFVIGGVRAGMGAGFEAFAQRLDAEGEHVGEPLVGLPREVGGQLYPAVAADGDDVWLVWEDTPSAEADSGIMVRHFPGRRDAGAAIALDDIFARPAVGPAVAAVGGSVLIAASGAAGPRLAWSRGGESFEALELGTAEVGAGGAAIAAVSPGRFAVVWTRTATGAASLRDIRFALVIDGALVAAPMTLATGKFPGAYRPAVAVRDGRLAVAFTESLGAGVFHVRVALASLSK